MKHIKKFNESKSKFDVSYFNHVFAEFIDNENDDSVESVDGSFWGMYITLPNVIDDSTIEESISSYKDILEIYEELKVCDSRIKDEYPTGVSYTIEVESGVPVGSNTNERSTSIRIYYELDDDKGKKIKDRQLAYQQQIAQQMANNQVQIAQQLANSRIDLERQRDEYQQSLRRQNFT